MQVADHVIGGHCQPLHRRSGEVRRQGLFGLCPAEDAIVAGPRHRHPHAILEPRHEDPGQGKAAGGLVELHIGGLFRNREGNARDDLAFFQRGGEHALEIVIRRDLAAVRHHRRAGPQHPRRIAGGRVVVGDGAADGATIAHRRITDPARQRGQRGVVLGRLFRDGGMGGGGPDGKAVIAKADALHLGNPGQGDEKRRRGKPLLHRGRQGLPARKGLRPLGRQRLDRIGDGGGFHEIEVVHGPTPLSR